MRKKIIGATVGTTMSPSKMASKVEEKINPVKTVNGKAPDENGNVKVEVNENTNITETDPTVPSWAKQSTKPSYSKSEVGLGNVDNVKQYSATNPPPYPVASVNGKTNVVTLGASDVGARPSTWTPTYSDVGADKSGTASSAVSSHNTNTSAHNDLRLLIEGLSTRLNALANSTDEDLDQMAELVAYIKSNKTLIDGITTSKVSVADIVNNLTSNVTNKPLSAAQGVALKALIDAIIVPTKVSELDNDAKYLTGFTEEDPTVPSWAKQPNKPSYTAEEVGAVSLDRLVDAINIALATAREGGEFDGTDGKSAYQYAQDGGYTGTEAEFAKMLAGDVLPDYWESYLPDKIAAIKALQSEGGKDCFSFVVMTDIHYPSNLGKRSPSLAKRILDNCNIKYTLCLGDTQTRGCYQTKEEILAENEQVKEMFAPIKDRLLQIEGNHDGSYYWSGGVVGSGTSYSKQLTEQEMFEEYYRANGLNGDVHFDKNSNAFYVDDVSNKVRYIGLNSMNVPNSKTDVNADGTAKYNKFRSYQFLQAQYDFLCNEALVTVPSDEWSVVVFGHSGIYNDGDYAVMVDVLSAYKDKTNCVAEYAGTAGGGAAYTNLTEPLPNNTTDNTKWVNGYRISSTAVTTSSGSGKTTCNPIPVKAGDVIRVKGVSFAASVDRAGLFKADGTTVAYVDYVSSLPIAEIGYELVDNVHTFTVLATNAAVGTFRCTFSTPTDPSAVIITKNEEIVEAAHGYDYVSVNHDFSDAKGKFIAYFHGHEHQDMDYTRDSIKDIATRCDAQEEYEEADRAERVEGTTTEQSFDVFTVNKATRKIYATKIGAGSDREISY